LLKDGESISENPYAPPVCPECFEEWFSIQQKENIKDGKFMCMCGHRFNKKRGELISKDLYNFFLCSECFKRYKKYKKREIKINE
jgi:hypothetical protein